MRILIVTPYLPHPRVGHGGGTAVRQQIRALARRHDVTLLALRRPGDPAEDDRLGLDVDVRVETVPFVDRGAGGVRRLALVAGRSLALLAAWRQGYPYYAVKYQHQPLHRRAAALMAELDPDVVQVEYLQLAAVLRVLAGRRHDARRPRLVLSSHEYGALPRRRRAQSAGWPRRRLLEAEARAWDRLARDASHWADAVLCVTDQDRELFAAAGARGLVTVPLGIDTDAFPPADPGAARRQMLFLGSFAHPPNRAAADLLCRRIWPRVAERLAGWRLVLAGPGSREFLASLPEPPDGVVAAGFVDDLDRLFGESRLFVAPLFEGGGIKIKILEAMARGIPLVTTPIGLEGIAARDQDLVGWAADPREFTARVVEMANDPHLAAARAARARAHVVRHFDWEAVTARLERVYRGELPSSG